MKTTRLVAVFGVMALAVAVQAADTQPASSTAPATASAPATELKAIRYQRTGGFAGTNDVIEITPAGEVVLQGKLMGNGKGQLTAEQKAKLLAIFADWPKEAKNYPAPPGVADAFAFKIRYGTVEISGSELHPEIPASFEKARLLLEEIAQGVKGK